MSEFKVGDHVRFTADGPDGTVFEIRRIHDEGNQATIWTRSDGNTRERDARVCFLTKTDAPVGPSPKQVADAMTARQMNALTEKIQATHAKMTEKLEADMAPQFYGPSEDAKRDRILPALRKIVAEWTPSAAFDAVQRALNENEITDAEARELLGMSPAVAAAMPMVPKPLEGEFAVKEADQATVRLLADLDIERRRASKLADECGHLQARLDASEGNVVTANAKAADLESDLRVARRTIQTLRDQIIKLGARPR